MPIEEAALNIYADGSSYSHPRSGGAGFRFITFDESGYEIAEDFFGSSYAGATNNQMELQACINALKEVLNREDWSHVSRVYIFTDSQYVVNNLNHAKFIWPKTKWATKTGEPVLNALQWKELLRCINKVYEKFRMRTDIEWVKGHSSDVHNRAVDKTAKAAAKVKSLKKIGNVVSRRKKYAGSKVQKGSVTMHGQRISIHIVNAEYLSVQKISRYRYQVISKNSPYFQCTDFIYSKLHLSAGHQYCVRVNANTNYPQVVKIFREYEKSNVIELVPPAGVEPASPS